jgi:ankyrin repeat protein
MQTYNFAVAGRHLSAAEGCYAVVHWLLHDAGAKPNPIDRFGRTPLEDAVGPLLIHLS